MKKKKLPDFLIVGAAKSGTTSLHHYLNEHPEIYLNSKKELRFLSSMSRNFQGPGDENVNNSIPKNLEEYKKLFSTMHNGQKAGDISPDYLYYYENSISNIKKYLTNPKVIIILRNPIERAYSQYTHFVRDGREEESFANALTLCKERERMDWEWAWQYINVGLYFNQVSAYKKNIKNVKVYLFEDLKSDPKKLIKDICEFLEVDSNFIPGNLKEKFNVSGIPKNKLLHNFLHNKNTLKSIVKLFIPLSYRRKIRKSLELKNIKKVPMKFEDRNYLKEFYRDDIRKLEKLIDRDLSHWLK